MTVEADTLREHILALMKSPQLGLPNYSEDPTVARRVGRILVEASARVRVLPSGKARSDQTVGQAGK